MATVAPTCDEYPAAFNPHLPDKIEHEEQSTTPSPPPLHEEQSTTPSPPPLHEEQSTTPSPPPLHKDQKPFQCGLCSVTFDINVELVTHVHRHALTKPYQCGYCKVSYDDNLQLTVHVEKHQLFVSVAKTTITGLVCTNQTPDQIRNRRTVNKVKIQRRPLVGSLSRYVLRDRSFTKTYTADLDQSDHDNNDDNEGSAVLGVAGESGSSQFTTLMDNLHLQRTSEVSVKEGGDSLGGSTLTDTGETLKSEVSAAVDETLPSRAAADFIDERLTVSFQGEDTSEQCQLPSQDDASKNRKVFRCGLCRLLFSAPKYLADHWKDAHSTCSHCGETFLDPRTIRDHLHCVHREAKKTYRPFLCALCNKAFPAVRTVREHIQKKHKKKFAELNRIPDPSRCPHLYEENEAQSCDKFDSDSRPYRCPECPARFKQHSHMSDHLNSVHRTEKPYQCGFCKERFKLKGHLRTHVRRQHGDLLDEPPPDPEPYKCTACGEVLKSQASLVKHSVSVHGVDRPFACTFCQSRFKQKIHLSDHVNVRHSSERPHPCPMCGEMFKIKHHVRQHLLLKHPDAVPAPYSDMTRSHHMHKHPKNDLIPGQSNAEETTSESLSSATTTFPEAESLSGTARAPQVSSLPQTRPESGIACTDRNSIAPRRNVQPSKTREPFSVCPVCGLMFSSKKFNNHLATHMDTKPHECTVCGRAFKLRKTLKVHSRTHTQEKPYSCEFCGKLFALKTTLTYHRHSHTNAKPYLCQFCGKGFNSHSNLMIHRRRHTGDKRYPCDLCEKKFYNRYGLKRHTLTHTDWRPLSCSECGKSYRNSTNLKYHLQKVHHFSGHT